jgi:hypothetical protein
MYRLNHEENQVSILMTYVGESVPNTFMPRHFQELPKYERRRLSWSCVGQEMTPVAMGPTLDLVQLLYLEINAIQ